MQRIQCLYRERREREKTEDEDERGSRVDSDVVKAQYKVSNPHQYHSASKQSYFLLLLLYSAD